MSARAMAVSVLPTPLGPTSRKTPIGRRGSVRPARAVLIALGHRLQGLPLADDALLQLVPQRQHRLDLVQHHLADGDAGPAGHHVGHRLAVHHRMDQRRLALHLRQLLLQLEQFAYRRRLRRRRPALRACRRPGRPPVSCSAARSAASSPAPPACAPPPAAFPAPSCAAPPSPWPAVSSARRASWAVPTASSLRRALISTWRWSISRRQSSRAGGVADWLSATRAQAVSSRLTALSGNCRSAM